MTDSEERQDIVRQATNLVFSFAQVSVTFLPFFGIGIGIGDRATGGQPPVQPVYWSFFIWFVIYAGCIAYGIYQVRPAQRENGLLRRIGWYTASAFIGVTAYALVAQFGGSDWILIGIFVWILASLLVAFFRMTEHRTGLNRTGEYAVLAPISLLTGWVSLAILVNIAAALKMSGMIPAGTVETAFSIVVLLTACLVASAIIYKGKGNAWYAFPVIWGLFGVVVANIWQQPNPFVAGTAALVALVLLGVLAIGRKKEHEETGGL